MPITLATSARRWQVLPALLALTLGVGTVPAEACTAFQLPKGAQPLVAKSYDWHMGQGLVMINKRGLAKRAIVLDDRDKPAQWTATHASVTFNQYGRELPCSGMNEAGLVVETLWLNESEVPPRDNRPAVTELQWVQYQLDRFDSVAAVIAHAQDLRVSQAHGRVHYFVADRHGHSAAFEHLGGKLVVSHDGASRARVLTNHTYRESAAYLQRVAGQSRAPEGAGSLARFVRAWRSITGTQPAGQVTPVSATFRTLDQVASSDTQWQLVYDPQATRVWFRTKGRRVVKQLDLRAFDLTCRTPVQVLDMDTTAAGDVTGRFRAYTEAQNRSLVARSLQSIAGSLPPGTTEALARYPNGLECAGPAH